jgi:hypothetical protein
MNIGMKSNQRIATSLPLCEIWDAQGIVSKNRVRVLGVNGITDLLRLGRVHFVIADAGSPLSWVPLEQCYIFWKSEGNYSTCHCEPHFFAAKQSLESLKGLLRRPLPAACSSQ